MIAARISAALGGARRVVNVGAGTGNYEPSEGFVAAVEPAREMIAQRQPSHTRVVSAVAEALPFRTGSFDAALAVLTLHHWHDLAAGLSEVRRVAARQVILMNEPHMVREFWLARYFPDMLDLPSERLAPSVDRVASHLERVRVEILEIPRGCSDGFGGAYWNRPEAFLDPVLRAGSSSLAQLSGEAIGRGVGTLRGDLESGVWDDRYGHLRTLESMDLGYRLMTAG